MTYAAARPGVQRKRRAASASAERKAETGGDAEGSDRPGAPSRWRPWQGSAGRGAGIPRLRGSIRYTDEADIENAATYHQCLADFVEAALEIRKAITPNEVSRAVTIDESLSGSNNRAGYITSVAGKGGLSVAALRGEIQEFCCIDHDYFFGKAFISLLIVAPDARRLGLGANLLSHNASGHSETWTSTNQSNSAMRKLLKKAGWRYCGELSGLEEGDPELFYRTA